MDGRFIRGWVPHVDPQGDLAGTKVHDAVDGLLLNAKEAPLLNHRVSNRVLWRRPQQLLHLNEHEVLVGIQRRRLLLELLLQVAVASSSCRCTGWPLVDVRTEGLADLQDLLLHGAANTLEVDHKHGLLHWQASLGVLEFLIDGLELHEGIAAARTPERTRQALFIGLQDHAGQVAKSPCELVRPHKGPLGAHLEALLIDCGSHRAIDEHRHGG
mmetsp:Transcript_9423/g.14965  ORF Transcript_9423/g.14965 Transcript_9423/m.14965 type:complete len:214 (-) Transcript_9423:231-872(-)